MTTKEEKMKEQVEKIKEQLREQRELFEARLEEEKQKVEKEREKRLELQREKEQLEVLVKSFQEKYEKQEAEHRERFHRLEQRMCMIDKKKTNEEGETTVVTEDRSDDEVENKEVELKDKVVHSTPKKQVKKKEKKKKNKQDVKKEETTVDSTEEERQPKKKKKAKRGSQKKRDRKIRMYVSAEDSLYSSTDLTLSTSEEYEEDSSEEEVTVQRGILIREVPKAAKFNVYSKQSMHDFFKQYESYCKSKFMDHPEHWVKELGEFLEGRMSDFYKTIVGSGPVKYDVVKERMLEHCKRVRGSVRFKRKDDFERAHMYPGENLDTYAYRLETLARQKFGNDEIRESKALVRKFFETIPEQVAEFFHMKRKERVRVGGGRLMWPEILELLEDRPFDEEGKYYPKSNIRKEREREKEREVRMGHSGFSESMQPRSFRDALKSNPLEIMTKFMEDFYARQDGVGRGNLNNDEWPQIAAGGNWNQNRNERNGGQRNQNFRGSAPNGNRRNGNNGRGNNSPFCEFCNVRGHTDNTCRRKNGLCYLCGQSGHLAKDCRTPGFECRQCKKFGHRARFCRAPGSECRRCGIFGHIARFCQTPYHEIDRRQQESGGNGRSQVPEESSGNRDSGQAAAVASNVSGN